MRTIRTILFALVVIISNSSTAQVSSVKFRPYSDHFESRLKLENNILFVTHSTGLYACDLTEMSVSGEFLNIYAFGGLSVNDFVFNSNKILAVTDNCYPAGHLLALSDSENIRDYTLFTPSSLILDSDYSIYPIFSLAQDPINQNNIIATTGYDLFKSENFGETWKHISVIEGGSSTNIEYNPINPDIIIFSGLSWIDMPGYDFITYSIDGGSTWNSLDGFIQPSDIAFHPTNSDIAVVTGASVAVTKDGCKTWEFVFEWDKSEIYVPNLIAFDRINGDRLYGAIAEKMMYSDDYGATWNDLCKLPFEGTPVDFVQYKSKIYCLSDQYELCEIDLDKIDTALAEIISDNPVKLSYGNGVIRWVSDKEVSLIEVYDISGISIVKQETVVGTKGEILLGEELKGVAAVVFYATDGERITRKINF